MNTLTLGLEWFLNPDHVPLIVAQEKGWFAEAGLQLEMVEPEEHLDAFEEIQAGSMDLAITEPLHLVEDWAKGKPVIGLARFLHTNGGVMYFGGQKIERPRDMAGCRIQYPGAPGPGGPAIVKTMIEADGGSCAPEDFERVNNGFYHTDALIEGKADVATLVFYNFEVLEARHQGHDARFFALKDWGVPDFCQLILITSTDTLQKKKDDIQRFLKVLQRGVDFIHQHPSEAKEIYYSRTKTDGDSELMNDIFDATVRCFTYDMSMATEYYEELGSWLKSSGLIEKSQGAAGCWTNEFLHGRNS